jgi:hypothetical protein
VRACAVCGACVDGKRSHARFCGPACRREHYRVCPLLRGQPDSGYTTLAQYLRKRATCRSERRMDPIRAKERRRKDPEFGLIGIGRPEAFIGSQYSL